MEIHVLYMDRYILTSIKWYFHLYIKALEGQNYLFKNIYIIFIFSVMAIFLDIIRLTY